MFKMWKCLFFACTLFSGIIFSENNYSIVFVHIGNELPAYAETAIIQARLFNPSCRIYLIANRQALKPLYGKENSCNITYVAKETLLRTKEHFEFLNKTRHTPDFWRYTSERFLYLHDFMSKYRLENVFHLENDNMLYANLEEFLPVFNKHYPGIGATFDADDRCIPGFMFIANPASMCLLANFFAKEASKALNDMQVIARFKNEYQDPSIIDALPIVMDEYVNAYPLQNLLGHETLSPDLYSNHADEFGSIFDAAAIGQYLGGTNRDAPGYGVGFVNERCLFNPSFFTYSWECDSEGRNVPYANFDGKKYRINNLHIHSKNLLDFTSMQE